MCVKLSKARADSRPLEEVSPFARVFAKIAGKGFFRGSLRGSRGNWRQVGEGMEGLLHRRGVGRAVDIDSRMSGAHPVTHPGVWQLAARVCSANSRDRISGGEGKEKKELQENGMFSSLDSGGFRARLSRGWSTCRAFGVAEFMVLGVLTFFWECQGSSLLRLGSGIVEAPNWG